MNIQKEDTQFISSLDWWIALLGLGGIAMLVVSIPLVIWKTFSVYTVLFVVVFLIISILLLIDRLFFTSYVLGKDGLLIHAQIRKVFIPYSSIRKISNGSIFDLFSSGRKKRFALSTNSLVLSLSNQVWTKISISPKQKQEFIEQLVDKIGSEKGLVVDHKKLKKSKRRK